MEKEPSLSPVSGTVSRPVSVNDSGPVSPINSEDSDDSIYPVSPLELEKTDSPLKVTDLPLVPSVKVEDGGYDKRYEYLKELAAPLARRISDIEHDLLAKQSTYYFPDGTKIENLSRGTYSKIMYEEFHDEFVKSCSAEDYLIALRLCRPSSFVEVVNRISEYINVYWLGRTVEHPHAYEANSAFVTASA